MDFMNVALGILPLLVASISMVLVVAGGFCALCMGFGTPYDPNAPKRAPAPASAADADHAGPNYLGIFGTLLALTVVTVILSRIDLGGAGNTTLAVGVASVKASLVALYFMHLKYERRLMFSLVLIPFAFFVALFVGLLPDLVTNNYNSDKNERPGFGVGIDTVR